MPRTPSAFFLEAAITNQITITIKGLIFKRIKRIR